MSNTSQPSRDFPPVMPAAVSPPPPHDAVIGRPDIGAELARTLPRGNPPSRDHALGIVRRQLARLQTHVQTRFERGDMSGLAAARLLSGLMDELLAALIGYAVDLLPVEEGDRLAVAATGGYGRATLAPFSDIDLLFLTDSEPSARVLRAVEFILYFMWDLGLKVGHATRSTADCLTESQGDSTIRTSLLDARCIAGDRALFAHFQQAFRHDCAAGSPAGYITAKQAERAARHRRFGDTPFMVEPNIKEGKGGLRDLQTLYWLARYVFGTFAMTELVGAGAPGGGILSATEARACKRAWDYLWSVRFHLHYVAGRAEERLTFDLQPVIGARMGYTRHGRQDGVERFMRHYFLVVREVARVTGVLEPAVVRAALGPPAIAPATDAALLDAGFVLADGKVLFVTGREPMAEPIQLLRILQVARDRGLKLHPLALRAMIRGARRTAELRTDPRAAALFLDLLCGDGEARQDGAQWLAILNETGALGRYLPDWRRIVGQMQFDSYHVYTVDMHTIHAIGVLNAIERGELSEIVPVASGLAHHVQSRRALYVALLLHDIAKGRGGDHSEIGAELALTIGPALGLDPEETEMVSWLVLHHLLLSQTAFSRDIDDPKTILDLADVVQSPERLRLLLILTVSDIRAVSPKVWNGWKATLLREIYARVAEVLEGGLATTERDTRVARVKQMVAELLSDWPDAERDDFLNMGYPGYWLGFDPESIARHGRMIRDARHRDAPLTVAAEPLPARSVTEVVVYTADHAGLFSRIAGALAVAGATIVDARIHTLTDGMALDTFWIQDAGGGSLESPHRLAKISAVIEQVLSGRLRLATEIEKATNSVVGGRMRAIHVPPRVVVDNSASNRHTVIEVNGRDRPGLLHDVTAAITSQGLQIASAHITTYGVRAVDVFYVKDVFGLKVQNERKLAQLRSALIEALAGRSYEVTAAS
ncbi:MAG TPA: [protein-PII] uridylyltransferase [Acidiphilium sp.]|jgi:[protein-PII] uridylyltransferase|uniref:[protein-PII] uridylyltransferase n=1 Tax=unclassified Acidiphilium TaxID=2617493 RepID=UPI000BD5611A|nr:MULTISPECIES: [protein-PII] uridylyltransferase [unclassified Acidiphilium]OYV57503.1 MAG: [protein-PII] uridylyltransferase [Acidiphilium sp. 20-67-58]HQT59624.1 [protein-PII] uridylyltransferase [Acidiphilium sp.]HQU10304.1 [protein-PII] uridylyltransferase [Acidiphilium sp.]